MSFLALVKDNKNQELRFGRKPQLFERRVNPKVRKLMNVIVEKGMNVEVAGRQKNDPTESLDQPPTTCDWTRTRNYFYRNYEKISTSQVEQVIDFLQETFPPKDPSSSSIECDLVPHILQSCPRIFRHNVQTFLRPTVQFLQELYGYPILVQAVQRNPNLLVTRGMGYDADYNFETVQLYLQQPPLQLSSNTISKLKQTTPTLFQVPLYKIISVVEYFRQILELSPKSTKDQAYKQAAQVIAKHPNLVQLSVKDNLEPKIKYLQEQCCLLDDEVGTVFLKQPKHAGILALSVEKKLRPTFELLLKHLKSSEVRKCIMQHPQLLALSINNLKSKIKYFESLDATREIDVLRGDSSLVTRILERAPATFSLSLQENIVPKIQFLSGIWGVQETESSACDDSIASMIAEYPTILTLSIEGNLRPTAQFFNRTQYIALDETYKLREAESVGSERVDAPTRLRARYLATSLYHRLLPRWNFVQLASPKGRALNETTNIPLHVLAGSTDAIFCQKMNISLVEYNLYKSEAVPQLRFFSQFEIWLKTGRPITE